MAEKPAQEELEKRVEKLEKELIKSRHLEEELQKKTQDLGERNRELDCLYKLSKLSEKTGLPLEEMVQEVLDLILSAWRYPEITCAQAVLEGREFQSRNFKETAWKLAGDVIVHGKRIGSLDVFYMEEKPERGEGPFLREERSLLNAIAEGLGRIIERKRTEEALRASEERFALAAKGTNDGIWDWDIKNNSLYWSPRMKELLGYADDELDVDFDTLLSHLYPDDIDLTNTAIEAHLKDRVPYYIESRMRTKSGEYRWFYARGEAVWDEAGKPLRMVGFTTDITERKQAEEALKESEERYRVQFDEALDTIFIADAQTGIIINCNNAATELVGRAKSELIGKHQRILHPPEEIEGEFSRSFKKHLKEKEGQAVEAQVITKNGEIRDVSIKANVFEIKGKRIIQGIFRDITDRKRAEEEKKRLEAQLRQAQKMEIIGILAGGVAHDLNNILTALVSYPELLLMEIPQDSPLRNPILTIQKSGERAATIVQDLLTLARRGVAVTEVLSLNDIILEYLKSPEHKKIKLYHPEVQLETHLDAYLLNILGSPVHLSKTVMNLVSNAAEAMPGGGKIIISTENRHIDRALIGYEEIEKGDYVTLTVSDTGVGISSEDMERIFEPFYTKKVMGRSGTGLGMAVVWGTVKDHKGYIDVESTEGKGATFMLFFPASREELEKEKPPLSIDDYMGKGESILIVDDVEEQREIASRILTKLGYSVTAVSSGEEAIDYMRNNPADLLMLDMIMDPGIDGLETYKRIVQFHPTQKAIIVSGFSETDRIREAQRLGAGAYIKKPYLLEKIGLAVRTKLDK